MDCRGWLSGVVKEPAGAICTQGPRQAGAGREEQLSEQWSSLQTESTRSGTDRNRAPAAQASRPPPTAAAPCTPPLPCSPAHFLLVRRLSTFLRNSSSQKSLQMNFITSVW